MLRFHELTLPAMLLRLALAVAVGGVLGLERGRKNRPADLRTYMLVCLGASVVMMTNQYVTQCMGTGDPVRMGAQVISGIGFLGAGSIMVTQRNQIRGITTAAGLWAAACLGLAIGIGFYEVSIAGGLIVFAVLTFVHKFDDITKQRSSVVDVYVELKARGSMSGFIAYLRDAGLNMSNLQMDSESVAVSGSIGFVVTIRSIERRSHESVMDSLRHIPDLVFLEEL